MGVGRGLLRIGLRNGFGFLIAKSEELENTIEVGAFDCMIFLE